MKLTGMKQILLKLVLPIGVLVVILYFFFDDVSPADIAVNLARVPATALWFFVGLSTAAAVLRAWKYHILLGGKIGFKDIFLVTLVRNFSVDLLPGRAAALMFYAWLTQKKGVALEEGASSFLVSAFYDAAALCVMLGALVPVLKGGMAGAGPYTAMGVIFVLSIAVILFAHRLAARLGELKLLRRFPRLRRAVAGVREYLEQHRSNKERLGLFVLSLGVRLLKYLFVFILFEAVVRIGFSAHHFALFCFGLAATELSALFPLQGPGGFGTWELAFALVFSALPMGADNIKVAGFVIHIITQAWEYALGLTALGYLYFGPANTKNKRAG